MSPLLFVISLIVAVAEEEYKKEVDKHNIGSVFDLSEFLLANTTIQQEIGERFDFEMQKKGFILLSNHGVKPQIIESLFDATEKFFSHSEEMKLKYQLGKFGDAGYQPFGTQNNNLEIDDFSETVPDLVESFDIRNIGYKWFITRPKWENLPLEFTANDVMKVYIEQLDIVRSRLHYLATIALDLDSNQFEMKMISQPYRGTFGSVRLNYYFELDPTSSYNNATRLGSHTDFLGFTILSADHICGLQFYVDEKWNDLECERDLFIVIAGDYIQKWTNDRWKAAKHRVVHCFGEDQQRISITFFTGPNSEELMLPFSGCKKCTIDARQHCKRKFAASQTYKF